jgi:CRISPR/Cas system-associated endoribonuclease Cas2
VIVYDIANLKKFQRELFRETLKRLNFLRLQKSVYITPFVCDDEIEYLRQVFDIGSEVLVLRVAEIENAQVYKIYFGI